MNASGRLSLPSATGLVIANMIGAGVFTTSGYALADLGDPRIVLFAWLVGGVLAALGATCYGALARRIPRSGGEYTFIAEAFHPAVGFLAGWISLLAGFTAPIAAAALALEAYVGHALGAQLVPGLLGSATLLLVGLMHGVHRGAGVLAQDLAVALKLLAIATFVAVGVARLPALEPVEVSVFDPGAFAVTLVWVSFAYSGWNAAVYVASEVEAPDRNLGRSLLLGTGIVTLVYLALNAVFLFGAPSHVLAGKAEVGAIAAEALGGVPLARALSALVALALFTSVSAMVMAGPRVYARMAEDGVFPAVFTQEGEVPAAAVALQVGASLIVVWSAGLRTLLGYIGFTLSACTAVAVLGLMRLRIREGPTAVPVPGWPVVPAIFVLISLTTLVFMGLREPLQALWGALTVLSGVPVYLWMRRTSAPVT